MQLDQNWFTEVSDKDGCAFSLKYSQKLHEEQSTFQKIEIYETTHFGKLMVIDGFVMLTQRDNFIYHEMMVQPVLYSHKNPERIAIIGGGDCGSLREVLKHNCVKKVTQIDIDERVTRVAEKYFPELCESNHDPRAELKFIDGVKWMQAQPENSLDVIIVDSTDPVGPGETLFSENFYASCAQALCENGLIVQQSESPLLHNESIVQPMKIRMASAGFNEINTLFFPQPVYPSGWWSATMAGEKSIAFERAEDCKNNLIKTNYYNSDIHHAAFAVPEFMKK